MKGHWEKYLNVRELLFMYRPSVVVECGAGSGENTENLLSVRDEIGFKLVVINDDGEGSPREEMRNAGVDWRSGISYLELATLKGCDFCLIDTDHNYWTLRNELYELGCSISRRGLCVMHDTETYGKNTGKMQEYMTKGVAYPSAQIEEAERRGLGMIDAINEAVAAGKWKIVRESKESHGAIAMERI